MMRVSQAKKLFQSLLQEYFAGAQVAYTRQSRTAKTGIPLVVITPGNVRRDRDPVISEVGGEIIGSYLSRISMQIDLFTKGTPIIDPDTGRKVASENTAMDDILAFADFLNSPHTVEWCHSHDVALVIDGDAQDLTDIVNDNSYEFRSRLTVFFYFTQNAVGHTATLSEDSIKFPDGEEPEETESTTGGIGNKDVWKDADIEPEFTPSSTGGGSEELASESTGYFTEAEIKEERE